jgi:hypothetical protein
MRFHFLVVATSLLAATTVANAAVVNFQDGFAGYSGTLSRAVFSLNPNTAFASQDTSPNTIRLDLTTNVYGAGTTNGIAQGLIRFDNIFSALAIPAGATISDAKLTFRTVNATVNTISLHRMTTNWGASTTWNSLVNGITLGTDALATADASRTGVSSTTSEFDVTSSVRAWAAGASNFGWAILTNGTDAWDFRTDNYGTTLAQMTSRPILKVTYAPAPVPLPSSAWLLGSAAGMLTASRRRKSKAAATA